MVREKKRRSVVKALTWRIAATVTTVTVSYLITGKVEAALSIGAAEFVLKLFIGFAHERLWTKIKFGLEVETDPEYTI